MAMKIRRKTSMVSSSDKVVLGVLPQPALTTTSSTSTLIKVLVVDCFKHNTVIRYMVTAAVIDWFKQQISTGHKRKPKFRESLAT